MQALRFDGGALWALDQTRLPDQEAWLELRTADDVIAAIQRLSIRGAPLIGVAGAYAVALEAARAPEGLAGAAARIRAARPTAVNLTYAVDRVVEAGAAVPRGELAAASLAEARRIHDEELAASAAMAAAGAQWLTDRFGERRVRLLTHCNTGALAAPGDGTALAVVAELHRRGRLASVLATESRPLLQGARLTVWELARLGVEHELIVDSAAAGLLARGAADAVIVGCDRVAANGDVANKVGTYGLALAAAAAGVPFLIAGPVSTIDPTCPSGEEIVVEERDADEVRHVRDRLVTLPGTPCRNPAFDVTPSGLVTAVITDRGVASPVDGETISALVAGVPAATPGAR
jgi:methylthioribose-1-phosphate isomerase